MRVLREKRGHSALSHASVTLNNQFHALRASK